MIKKIPLDQLRVGMYVHDLTCSWMQHGFVRPRFPIKTAAELQQVRKLNISELYIDTEKGGDVEPEQSEPTPIEPPPAPPKHSIPRSLGEERLHAKRIHNEALGVVAGLMEDVRLGQQIDTERANPVIGEMVDSIFRNPDALLGLTRIRNMDRYTFEHSVNVSVLMVSFARSLDLDRALIADIGIGALLHDIGKIVVPPEILNKPAKLTDEEFKVMRGHVVHSRDILSTAPNIPPAALAVAAEHHERRDGGGYPNGKKDDEISMFGRMAAIVDVYDAITADRVYHKGMEPHVALRKILEWSKQQFDPQLVQQFIRCVGIYPIGTLVKLRSGRLGVVVQSSRDGLLHPVVRVFMDARHRRYLSVEDIDLAKEKKRSRDEIESAEIPERWSVDLDTILKLQV